jgi:hypothetical protein
VTECTQYSLGFQSLKRRKVEAEFSGGDITSDGGALLLREMDRRLGLLASVDRVLQDGRDRSKVVHSQLSLLQQRVYGLCLGYEDLNDHQTLRHDPAIQTAVNRLSPLASQSTLCRLENRADRKALFAVHAVMLQQFIASFRRAPRKLVLDFDATDDRVHGMQEGRFFHGYYDHHCFLPLYVFCGEQLLVNYLRPSNIDGAKHAWAILALLVKRLRQVWPKVRIIFRGDSGFCREHIMLWCELNDVDYVLGLAKNQRLKREIAAELEQAKTLFQQTHQPARVFKDFRYQTLKSWSRSRRVVGKAEYLDKGENPRFVVTSMSAEHVDAHTLYEQRYCARGDMENRIKEQQLWLFADRTSCATMRANQLRLWFSSVGYTLMQALRRLGLRGTKLAKAQCGTIRLKLLKVGAQIRVTVRKIWVSLSEGYPYQQLFRQVYENLAALCPIRLRC